MTHLKRINKVESICGSKVELTKELFDVNCRICIDLVITKRVKEIGFLEEAKAKSSCVNKVMKVNRKEVIIRY